MATDLSVMISGVSQVIIRLIERYEEEGSSSSLDALLYNCTRLFRDVLAIFPEDTNIIESLGRGLTLLSNLINAKGRTPVVQHSGQVYFVPVVEAVQSLTSEKSN